MDPSTIAESKCLSRRAVPKIEVTQQPCQYFS
jgi:hypothetical protein